MRNISFSSASAGFNNSASVHESKSRIAAAADDAALPAPEIPPAEVRGLPAARSSARAPQRGQVATRSSAKSPEHACRARAFDAQRVDINTQAGPSNNPHLSAIDKLQQRGFKPAPGGLQIPFTRNALLGGTGKRVYQFGSSSRHVNVVPAGNIAKLTDEIRKKEQLIIELTEDIENPNDDAQLQAATENRDKVNEELFELRRREVVLTNENLRLNNHP
ncbi:type III effector AvrRps4 [Xanthomonas hyacinthi]|uniref:type III effector AvrRps4 n=1 Tax=Xanthomonas hyacinthi TaxID=56455 RepID=UPI0011B087D8|nr:type III effector AvrRps4 [Xanthomonas hyacinthi]QGY75546.1 type III effector AvrRps4 [Xanthomonas hyacinthi]